MIVARQLGLTRVVRYVGRPLLALLAWDVVIAVLFVVFHQRWVSLNELPMALIGTALALLLTIRNNNAYGRWWEARSLCGGLVNSSRTFARQLRLFLMDQKAGEHLVLLQIAFAQSLRCHLRNQDPWDELTRLLGPSIRSRLQGVVNVPDALLGEIATILSEMHRSGQLDSVQVAALDATLAVLSNVQGGTERIKNTPLPRQYAAFPRVFAEMFCILLPLAIVSDLGLATPLGSTLVGFIFLALDQVGADLENPFSNTIFDVPLSSITRMIEINLRQTAGLGNVPLPLDTVKGVLW